MRGGAVLPKGHPSTQGSIRFLIRLITYGNQHVEPTRVCDVSLKMLANISVDTRLKHFSTATPSVSVSHYDRFHRFMKLLTRLLINRDRDSVSSLMKRWKLSLRPKTKPFRFPVSSFMKRWNRTRRHALILKVACSQYPMGWYSAKWP